MVLIDQIRLESIKNVTWDASQRPVFQLLRLCDDFSATNLTVYEAITVANTKWLPGRLSAAVKATHVEHMRDLVAAGGPYPTRTAHAELGGRNGHRVTLRGLLESPFKGAPSTRSKPVVFWPVENKYPGKGDGVGPMFHRLYGAPENEYCYPAEEQMWNAWVFAVIAHTCGTISKQQGDITNKTMAYEIGTKTPREFVDGLELRVRAYGLLEQAGRYHVTDWEDIPKLDFSDYYTDKLAAIANARLRTGLGTVLKSLDLENKMARVAGNPQNELPYGPPGTRRRPPRAPVPNWRRSKSSELTSSQYWRPKRRRPSSRLRCRTSTLKF